MAKYTVDFAVTGYYALEVEAADEDQAREEASALICGIDFGALSDIDSYPIHVLDENGSYVWQEG